MGYISLKNYKVQKALKSLCKDTSFLRHHERKTDKLIFKREKFQILSFCGELIAQKLFFEQ